MIIDLILDKQEGQHYNPRDFYYRVRGYSDTFDRAFDYIVNALDAGTNDDIIKALCRYIDEEEYNPKIKDYIKTQDWLTEDNTGAIPINLALVKDLSKQDKLNKLAELIEFNDGIYSKKSIEGNPYNSLVNQLSSRELNIWGLLIDNYSDNLDLNNFIPTGETELDDWLIGNPFAFGLINDALSKKQFSNATELIEVAAYNELKANLNNINNFIN